MRKLIFALIEAGQNLARRRRKILTFRRGDPLEIDQFWCLPEYKLVKFGAHFAGIEAGRQFPEIWPILAILRGGLVLGIPRYMDCIDESVSTLTP